MINRIAKLKDLEEDVREELMYFKSIGYSGEHDCFSYDYIYKFAKMLKIAKGIGLTEGKKKVIDLGGGLSPLQFILSKNCEVLNMDMEYVACFPTNGKYYDKATPEFVAESEKNFHNVSWIQGDILQTIKDVEDNSIDAIIDTCSLHIFISDGSNTLINEFNRVLKPGGHLISIGDVANPNLGLQDSQFQYPDNMALALSANENLKLIEPTDYTTWEPELMDHSGLCGKTHINYDDLSLIHMKYDPMQVRWGNIPSMKIHLWVATFVLQKQ